MQLVADDARRLTRAHAAALTVPAAHRARTLLTADVPDALAPLLCLVSSRVGASEPPPARPPATSRHTRPAIHSRSISPRHVHISLVLPRKLECDHVEGWTPAKACGVVILSRISMQMP